MKLILLLILTIPTIALAEKKMTAKDMSMLGKIDENSIKNAEPNKPVLGPETAEKSKFSVSCKESNGVEYKSGDVGYDTCLNNLKTRSDFSKMNSGLNKKDAKDASGSNLNFKIGD